MSSLMGKTVMVHPRCALIVDNLALTGIKSLPAHRRHPQLVRKVNRTPRPPCTSESDSYPSKCDFIMRSGEGAVVEV
jgi:hypothetical protein